MTELPEYDPEVAKRLIESLDPVHPEYYRVMELLRRADEALIQSFSDEDR